MSLAWAASPKLLIRYTVLGMFNSIIPPLQVWLGAQLVNKIAETRQHQLEFTDLLPIIITAFIYNTKSNWLLHRLWKKSLRTAC